MIQAADLILANGKIATADARFSVQQALAIRDGRIVTSGRNEDVQRLAGPSTKQVDLRGRLVTPGFIDGHPHMFGLEDVPLRHVKSVADILEVIRREASGRPLGEWIVLEPPGEPPYYFHMPEALAEKRLPSRTELDQAAPDHPVYIKMSPFAEPPVTLFNSGGLQALRIGRGSGPIAGVEVVRTSDGSPSGEVIGNLSYFSQSPLRDRLWALSPHRGFEEQLAKLRQDMAAFNACGITAIYEGHGMPDGTIDLYRTAHERGESTVRAYLVKAPNVYQQLEKVLGDIAELQPYRGQGTGDAWFKVGGFCIAVGDNVGFGAGLMHEAYPGPNGQPWKGLQLIDEDKFFAIAREAARLDLRVNVQASGEAAIDMTMRVFARVNAEVDITARRWVLEHCQFPSPQSMDKCRELGVIPTTVPNFLWGQGNAYLKHYGGERTNSAVPLRSWLEHQVPVVLSADYGPHQAMFMLWQCIARKNGWTGETLGAEESIGIREGIRIFTNNGARVCFWENDLGSLEPGKLADLVVLENDILTVPVDEIRETKILATVVGGNVVYGSLDF